MSTRLKTYYELIHLNGEEYRMSYKGHETTARIGDNNFIFYIRKKGREWNITEARTGLSFDARRQRTSLMACREFLASISQRQMEWQQETAHIILSKKSCEDYPIYKGRLT